MSFVIFILAMLAWMIINVADEASYEYSAVKRPHFRMSGTARPRRGYRLSALRYR